ncbi:MAG TPA: hypothetical protein VFJ70_15435 [Burkholderiales bacterium]|nr:hypothetical protein [Burkholderiales bacterium]
MNRRSGLFLLGLAILIAGLVAGTAIYVLADEPEASAYVIIGDTAFPVDPATSKAYQRQLERYGGKMAVVFDDISRWLAARFQGKQLGVTVAAASTLTALVLFFAARRD